ncbi:hypothetical protein OK074_3185 [Actinobacteria bacterium OK074]|nr:hypothetical protein OK074_3185 [Actinobacteria bacterium OK074]
MSENEETNENEAATAPTEAATAPAEVPPKQPRDRRRIAAIAGGAALALAVVAGVTVTVVTVSGADRDAGKPVWRLPKAGTADTKTKEATGLAGLLLPYGTDGFAQGPDIGEYGADAVLTGKQATALAKESLTGLPRTQRLALEKQIDKQPIKGIALRSYVSTGNAYNSTVYAEKAYTMNMQLARLDSEADAKNMATYRRTLMASLGVFDKGPKVPGHADAGCFLLPDGEKHGLTAMTCTAYQSDVLVSVAITGTAAFDTKGAALFLSEQLDRIGDPGEAV